MEVSALQVWDLYPYLTPTFCGVSTYALSRVFLSRKVWVFLPGLGFIRVVYAILCGMVGFGQYLLEFSDRERFGCPFCMASGFACVLYPPTSCGEFTVPAPSRVFPSRRGWVSVLVISSCRTLRQLFSDWLRRTRNILLQRVMCSTFFFFFYSFFFMMSFVPDISVFS